MADERYYGKVWNQSDHRPNSRFALFYLSFLLAGMLVAAIGTAQVRTTYSVVTPDGVTLATDVYLPFGKGFGPWPVIFQRTPYGREKDAGVCQGFAALGYACVTQDVRGCGASTGQFAFSISDRNDGHTTLDWIARQSWCNGKVGSFGASALGLAQYALAPGAGSALRCQIPVVATPDLYHHAVFAGGALREALVYNWLNGLNALNFYNEISNSHRLWDSWWASFAVLPDIATINVPALHVGGWYDIFTQGTLDAFSAYQHAGGALARGQQHLIMGPWTHAVGTVQAGELAYTANAMSIDDLLRLWVEWYDHRLKGKSNGVNSWPAVRIYLMGAVGEADAPGNVWVDLNDWPPPTYQTKYYLSAKANLDVGPAQAGEIELYIDPANPVPTRGGANLDPALIYGGRPIGWGAVDQREIEARSDVLVFETAPLEVPLWVVGRIAVHIYIRPDSKDCDLAVRLTDVYPDGRSMLVTDGIARARARCGDDRECLLTPGHTEEMVVDLQSTAMVFNKGHRLRLVVSGSNYPRFEVNPNDGGVLGQSRPGVIARPHLLFGPDTPSHLDLPIWPQMRSPRRHFSRFGGGE